LGVDGRAAGTIVIGTVQVATPPFARFFGSDPSNGGIAVQNSIAVSDGADEVVAVWAERTGTANPVFWNKGNLNGAWGSAAALPQIVNLSANPDLGLPLRMNASGNAVLGWTSRVPFDALSSFNQGTSRILRYTAGGGWSGTAITLLSPVGPLFGQTGPSDLQLLSDGTIAFSDLIIASGASANVYRQSGANLPVALVPAISGNFFSSDRVSIASDDSGNAIAGVFDGSGVRALAVNVPAGSTSPASPFVLSSACTYGIGSTVYTKPVYAASMSARFSAFAFTTDDASTPHCFLKLVSRDSVGPSIRISSTAPGTFMFQPPVLAMDLAGNGVAVWQQMSGATIQTETVVPVWSQSPPGGDWSVPQIIGSNWADMGEPVRQIPIRFALNRAGQGVAAIVVHRVGFFGESIATARYSVSTGGWTPWTLVAHALILNTPNVAINDAGDAFLIYAAHPCLREGIPAVIRDDQCETRQKIYVLKL
jgi:hypothetical protein